MTSAASLISPQRSLRLLAEQGELLAAMPESALGEPVPAVPGWTVEDVLRHTARGDRWVTAVLRADPGADVWALARTTESSPHGPQVLADYRESLDGLLAEFARHDLAEPAATFIGPKTVGWWARRRACENVIHRHDEQSGHQAQPDPVEPASAVDAVDEWAQVLAPSVSFRIQEPLPDSLIGKRLALEASDVPGGRWVMNGEKPLFGARSEEGALSQPTGGADATLKLPAWELLLTVWRRRPLDITAATGESSIARDIYDYIRT